MHKKISIKLTKHLQEVYGEQNVGREHSTGFGSTKIDLVVNINEELIFFEIKTYNSVKTCIREALGQLLEYTYWPNLIRAQKMVVVTQHKADEEVLNYFAHLRKVSRLPIYYLQFDLKTNLLVGDL